MERDCTKQPSKLIKGLSEYFDETDPDKLADDLDELDRFNNYGPKMSDYIKRLKNERVELYNELLSVARSADKQGGYIGLGGKFGSNDTYIRAMRLSPKGECEDEVRDVEFQLGDFFWYDNILQCDDIFPDKCLRSILSYISHGNSIFVAYD